MTTRARLGLAADPVLAGHAQRRRVADEDIVTADSEQRAVPRTVDLPRLPDLATLRGDWDITGGNGVDLGHGRGVADIGTVPRNMPLFAAQVALHLIHGNITVARGAATLAARRRLVGLPRIERCECSLLIFFQQGFIASSNRVHCRSGCFWLLFGLGVHLLLVLRMHVLLVLGSLIHLRKAVVGPHSVTFSRAKGS